MRWLVCEVERIERRAVEGEEIKALGFAVCICYDLVVLCTNQPIQFSLPNISTSKYLK